MEGSEESFLKHLNSSSTDISKSYPDIASFRCPPGRKISSHPQAFEQLAAAEQKHVRFLKACVQLQAINHRLGGYWVGERGFKFYTYVKIVRSSTMNRGCRGSCVLGRYRRTAASFFIYQILLFACFELERIARRCPFRRFRANSKQNGTLSQCMKYTTSEASKQKNFLPIRRDACIGGLRLLFSLLS